MNTSALGFVVAALIVAAAAWAVAATSLLKDTSDSSTPPYSFARSQLLWWTVIIAVCICLHYALTGDFPAIDRTTVILLGISAGTTGAASIQDQRQDAASELSGEPRSQDQSSEGWLKDVLSDKVGPSVHRFQVLAFNFAYGVFYLGRFIADGAHALPTFDGTTLTLLGLSASTYVVLKNGENDVKAAPEGAAGGDGGWVG